MYKSYTIVTRALSKNQLIYVMYKFTMEFNEKYDNKKDMVMRQSTFCYQ